jgi:hypothetical protein
MNRIKTFYSLLLFILRSPTANKRKVDLGIRNFFQSGYQFSFEQLSILVETSYQI